MMFDLVLMQHANQRRHLMLMFMFVVDRRRAPRALLRHRTKRVCSSIVRSHLTHLNLDGTGQDPPEHLGAGLPQGRPRHQRPAHRHRAQVDGEACLPACLPCGCLSIFFSHVRHFFILTCFPACGACRSSYRCFVFVLRFLEPFANVPCVALHAVCPCSLPRVAHQLCGGLVGRLVFRFGR